MTGGGTSDTRDPGVGVDRPNPPSQSHSTRLETINSVSSDSGSTFTRGGVRSDLLIVILSPGGRRGSTTNSGSRGVWRPRCTRIYCRTKSRWGRHSGSGDPRVPIPHTRRRRGRTSPTSGSSATSRLGRRFRGVKRADPLHLQLRPVLRSKVTYRRPSRRLRLAKENVHSPSPLEPTPAPPSPNHRRRPGLRGV